MGLIKNQTGLLLALDLLLSPTWIKRVELVYKNLQTIVVPFRPLSSVLPY
jgi:hypothetical protein